MGFGIWDFVAMLPKELTDTLRTQISKVEHPRELAVDVMLTLQNYYGYLSDEALEQGALLLGMTPLELEELATFYDFIYRERVGRFVIHVCDGVVCWMNGYQSVLEYLSKKLGVKAGETTGDGLFTILPTACIGYCDLSPAMLINGRPYGPLTPEKIDEILDRLKREPPRPRMAR
ncbi:MAG: NADH-quinone oxidoreductase subunit NuoE [Thermodesulfobacteriota bacterium]